MSAQASPRSSSAKTAPKARFALALVAFGLLSSAGFVHYRGSIETAKVTIATEDLRTLFGAVHQFHQRNGRLPSDLGELGFGELRDPWGQAYHYVPHHDGIGDAGERATRAPRFGLFSSGQDGSASDEGDNLVLADDGKFVGVLVRPEGQGEAR